MTIKISAKKIGIDKPIEIKPTVGLKQESNNIMIKILESSTEESQPQINRDSLTDEEKEELDKAELKKAINYAKSAQKTLEDTVNFVKNTLKLTEKQTEKLKYSIDENELGEYVFYLVQRINGASEEEIALNGKIDAQKQANEDPKKG